MSSVLVVFAHPSLEKSRLNRAWIEQARTVPGVGFIDLYAEYPDFDVDVAREQERLEAHDVIVLQHPMYWYSVPALLKQWFDLVLTYGWAYGSGKRALRGKRLLSAVSMGGKEEAYTHDGHHGATVNELLLPIKKTAQLCELECLPPFLGYGALSLSKPEVQRSAQAYRKALAALVQADPSEKVTL